MTTTQLDPAIFPYVIECMECPYDTMAEVTHEEAEDAIPIGVEATPRQAVGQALIKKGWGDPSFGRMDGWLCPKCFEDLE